MGATVLLYVLAMSSLYGAVRVLTDVGVLILMLFVELEIYLGIHYFVSGKDFKKPKLFKRVNIVAGCVVLLCCLGGYLNMIFRFGLELKGMVVLPMAALALIVIGHGLNFFFDGLHYFLHEKDKKWYWATWNVVKIAVSPVLVFGSVIGAAAGMLMIGLQ